MEQKPIKIIVIGAGYAGLLATVRLAMKTQHNDVSITLINPSEIFVERPRLHQLAANQVLKPRPIRDVLKGSGVTFLQADVQAIDVRRREVTAHSNGGNQQLAFDYLLYTAGSTIDVDRVPGVREYAYRLTPSGEHSAQDLKALLPELDRTRGHLLVVGGGPTGIEAAAEFAESYPYLRVTLVTEGKLAHKFISKIQLYIRKALVKLGVTIREQLMVRRVEQNRLITQDGEAISFDVCLWAGGFVASPLARQAGLKVNEQGQLLIDPAMRSLSDSHIYAAGDSAEPMALSGIPVRMAAYTAAITGAHAADCLANAIHGKPQKGLNFAYLGQAIALGRHDTVGFNNFPDDKQKKPIFTGLLGVLGREFFVKLLADLPNIERRHPGIHFWPSGGRTKSGSVVWQEKGLGG